MLKTNAQLTAPVPIIMGPTFGYAFHMAHQTLILVPQTVKSAQS